LAISIIAIAIGCCVGTVVGILPVVLESMNM
jgi:TctA family transporter